MDGADLGALATACALRIIDRGEVVDNVDCIVGAVLFALAAGDTAVCACLSCLCALCAARALNDNARHVGNKMDNRVGTCASADSATDTLLGIDARNAVLDRDCALGTYAYAIAVAEAGEGAKLVTRVCEVCRPAGLVTLKIVFRFSYAAGAVACNVSNLLDNIARLKAEDSRDTACRRISAGNAERGIVTFARGECLCISIASAVSAGTAVCAGQTVTHLCLALVNGNAEEMVRHGEKHSREECNTHENKNRN